MKKLNPFAKSSIAYLFAAIVGQGFSFVAIIVFTRLMSKESYGLYSTYYAWVSICNVLVGANLFTALNNAYIDHKQDIYPFRKTILFLSSIICLALTFVILIARSIFFRQIALPVFLFAIVHAYSFFAVNYRMYSANMENDRRTKSLLLILPNALQFLFALALVLLFKDNAFYARVVGSTLGVLACAVVVFIEMMKKDGPLIRQDYWTYSLKISVPTIAMSLSYMLMQQCDKIMITKYCGEEFTAVYSVLFYLSYALIVVNQAIGAVRQVWIYNMLDKKGSEKFAVLQKWYLICIAVMMIGTFMIAPEAIRILVPSSYWEYSYVAPFVFSASMMVMYGFYSDVALFYKRNTLFSACVVSTALLNLILNAVFIRRFGAIAAAYTTAASYLILFILLRFFFGHAENVTYSLWPFLLFLAFTAIMSGVYLFTMEKTLIRYVLSLILLLLVGIYLISRKSEWMPLVIKPEDEIEG